MQLGTTFHLDHRLHWLTPWHKRTLKGSGLGSQSLRVLLDKHLLQPPPSDTFFGQNSNKTDYRDYSRDQRSRSRSKERRQGSRTRRRNNFSPARNGASSSGFKHNSARSGHTHTSFHSKGPRKTNFLIDTGAQRSCLGKKTFLKMGGNLNSLNTSKNSFIFGDGPSTPSLGKAKITISGYIFSIDIVNTTFPD